MILYYGSNVEVLKPKLLENQRRLDFGKGFYTTADLSQAKKWVLRTQKIRNSGKACVCVYDISGKSLTELCIQRFEEPNKEWLAYVTANRRENDIKDNFDIVMGPVANDQTIATLVLYMDGFLTEDETIRRLLPQKLKDQIVFKTEKALKILNFREVLYI